MVIMLIKILVALLAINLALMGYNKYAQNREFKKIREWTRK